MIDIDQALDLVLSRVRSTSHMTVPVAQSLGHILAADIVSDVDSPPHDKSMMDGYALRSADVQAGTTDLRVLEEVVAGAVPSMPVGQGEATRIMTGAPIPSEADVVVMVEQTELLGTGGNLPRVRILAETVERGQNIMRRGTSITRGEPVLIKGTRVRAIEVGLLCEVGCGQVPVHRPPSVAVLPTGDELVSVSEKPGPGQIRNSNGPMLVALARTTGAKTCELPVGRDHQEHLQAQIRQGLNHDVLLLSGGVSAGSRDLVPAALEALGVQPFFHKVRLRPGKPLWFGVRENDESAEINSLVFGLPGNPVSSLVCFELFVRPALAKLAGQQEFVRPRVRARLASPFSSHGDRPTYFPAKLSRQQPLTVEPLNWHGSADLRTLTEADGLAYFPAGNRQYESGEEVEVHPLS